jgi:hypothetical protein
MRPGSSCAPTARCPPTRSGELVLGVLRLATPARVALSDSICTALQLTEHCQDVAEDLARGRVYLPAEDLARFGCTTEELAADHAGEPLRRLLAFEVARARALLADGAPLIDELHGRPRLAVAAFVAGGRAALDAIERAATTCSGPAARRLGAAPAGARGDAARDARAGSVVSGAVSCTADAYATAKRRSRERRPRTSTTASACSRPTAPRDVRGVCVRPAHRRHRRRHARARGEAAPARRRGAGARRARRPDRDRRSRAPIR